MPTLYFVGHVPIAPIGGVSGGAANAGASTSSLTAGGGKFFLAQFPSKALNVK